MFRFNRLSPRLVLALGALAVTTACATTAPTAEEKSYVEEVKARQIMPASTEDRAAIEAQDALTRASFWGIEYEKNPGDVVAAVAFSKVLREIGSDQRAAEVASQTLALAPENADLLSILGKALLAGGEPASAVDTLRRAGAANPRDVTVLGALGVAYDQTGRHREAQSTYRAALLIEPARASLLSNLGLSLALTGEASDAETILRQAIALPEAGMRERQNLAMVLALQGKFDQARDVAGTDLPDTVVDTNLAYFQAMLTPANRNYGQLRGSIN